MPTPSLAQFDEYVSQLNQHDWFYFFTESQSDWTRSDEAANQLREQKHTHPIMERAYYACWMRACGTEQNIDAQLKDLRSSLH